MRERERVKLKAIPLLYKKTQHRERERLAILMYINTEREREEGNNNEEEYYKNFKMKNECMERETF